MNKRDLTYVLAGDMEQNGNRPIEGWYVSTAAGLAVGSPHSLA